MGWAASERNLLDALDVAVHRPSVTLRLDALAGAVGRKLADDPGAPLAWETVPLDWYGRELPGGVRSSWVFVLRANTVTGAERHPNSHQRMVSYRGHGDFQVWRDGRWHSHRLRSDPQGGLEGRWISIPRNVFHQGVVPGKDWAVVSFHTVPAAQLIEERGDPSKTDVMRRRKYLR